MECFAEPSRNLIKVNLVTVGEIQLGSFRQQLKEI